MKAAAMSRGLAHGAPSALFTQEMRSFARIANVLPSSAGSLLRRRGFSGLASPLGMTFMRQAQTSASAIDEVAEADINSTTVVELERLAAVDAHGIPLEAAAANVAMAEFSSDDEPLTFASLFTDASDSEAEGEIDESLLVANCNLSDVTVKALAERGIQSLFAIQKVVFEPAMAGSDVVARAKTGSGKTLAFALPVVEKIMAARGDDRSARGRNPKCIVLAPTRELAKQVEREFASVAPTLKTGCYYGGTPIGPQLRELQRGMDIVVGTPGRIIDLIGQRALNLSEISFVVLDEADQMLNVGFEEDVENILQNVPTERQTMMFSATLPKWVKKLVKQYLNNPQTIDLVGEEQSGKLADSITAMAVQVTEASRRSILVDLLTVYADGGKAIVFTQTKRNADEVAAAVALHMPCEPLHGDMAQAERERVLAGFRSGRSSVLVATDVAARGLDISDCDLVVHYELPRDPEAFLHRCGRTGRAGKTGTAIVMYDRSEIGYLKRILRETETTNAISITPPNPRQVVEAAAKQCMYRLDGVDEEVRSYFAPVAKLVLSSKDPQDALTAALAALSGIKTIPEPRSLLTLQEGYVTLQMMSAPGRIVRPGNIPAIVSRLLSTDKAASIGRIRMMVDEANNLEGAAFDVPKSLANEILANSDELQQRGVQLTTPASLPPEEGLYDPSPYGSRGGRGRGDDRYGGDRRRSGGGRGRSDRYGGDRDRNDRFDRGGSRGRSDRFGGDRPRGDRFGSDRRGDKYGGGGGGGERYGGGRGGGRGGGGMRGWDFNGGSSGGGGEGRRGGKVFDAESW